jgi:hypothetical protein
MGRDAERDQDPDDWFAEPDTSAVTRRSNVVVPPETVPAASEDWLSDPDDGTRLRTGPLPVSTKIAVAAVGLVAALVVGLLVGGVFDSKPAPTVTPTTVPQTTTRPTTSTANTPTAFPVPTKPLAPGDKGAAVTELQRALARAGYPVGTIDGQYGPSTKNAVAQFQAAQGLTADGIAGAQTLAALNTKLNGP